MLFFDRGLKLSRADLAVDVRRRQPRGFISHAHNDHMARHELALCTPETAQLYKFRLGSRDVLELPYGKAVEFGGLTLKTYPAGHCLGSAMLWAEDNGVSLLYTGDFKLGPSATSPAAELPRADILVMESTYGDPKHCHAPREELAAQLVTCVQEALNRGVPPVIQAYSLGKAQEITRLLTLAGIPVQQEHSIWQISQIYTACGVDLGQHELYPGYWRLGHAVVVPPRFHRPVTLPGLKREFRIAVTGWASDPRSRARWGVDVGIPLSDHADYTQLLQAAEIVQPKLILCTHGPDEFVYRLRAAGHAQVHLLAEPERWMSLLPK